MNFIREVIDIANENKIIDSRRSILRLLDEIKTFQLTIKSYIDDNYTEFSPNLQNGKFYLDEGEHLLNDVANFKKTIDETQTDLIDATEELEQYLYELEEAYLGLKTSCTILFIDNCFHELETAKNNGEILKSLNYISEIKGRLYDPDEIILKQLDCFENIKIKYFMENELLLHNLSEQLKALIQLNEKNFTKNRRVTIKISKDEDLLHETIVALSSCKYNPRYLWDFLLCNVFEPIITKPVSIESQDDQDDFVTLILSFSIDGIEGIQPNYKTVFDNFKFAVKYLSNMNILISNDDDVFKMFGDYAKDKLLRLLKTECLEHSIPDTMEEMNNSSMVDDVLEFNDFLFEMRFFRDDDDELKDFANKIAILFEKRFRSKLLDAAVDVMHMNLQDMTLIKQAETISVLNGSPANFPSCMVSKSTENLINLLEKILRQITLANDKPDDHLVSTISIILERYIIETPSFHAHHLQTIPQQSALFHNNCLYLMYWISRNAPKNADFSNIIKALQTCGSKQLFHQIDLQRDQLMEILKDFDLSNIQNELDIRPKKVVQQCLRQMDLLKNVWQTILAESVYNKTMGGILNNFTSEIIRRIITVEDISSNVAKELVSICDIIIERCPYIFQDQMQISIIVKTWSKLTQLRTILNASLSHICDLWSEGKGPLTLNYKSSEIKHLIRALFQNTDRRANALASIV